MTIEIALAAHLLCKSINLHENKLKAIKSLSDSLIEISREEFDGYDVYLYKLKNIETYGLRLIVNFNSIGDVSYQELATVTLKEKIAYDWEYV